MNLIIDTKSYEDCTMGRLFYKDFQCMTLELPWLNNEKNISCFTPGIYKAIKYNSPKHGDVILLLNVKDRKMIEIHAGNFTYQIEGCCLIGDSIKDLNKDSIPDVTNSKNTLTKLLAILPNEFFVEVRRS